ncbi:MAG: tRNA-dihydrouridine synthase, partial [Phocaeicola sp.]
AFAECYSECRKPLVYNGDLCSVADINRVVEKYPDLYGVMIGRGLLANGALAAEYKSGYGFTQEELYAKVRRMHSIMYERYSEVIEGGDAQLLLKMKSMWEYWLPELDKKKRKAIHKANKLSVYLNEVEGVR